MKKANLIALSSALLIVILFSGCSVLFSRLAEKSDKKVGNYSELVSKKEELANLQTTEKLDEGAQLRGKIAIAIRDADGHIKLDRLSDSGEFNDSPPSEKGTNAYFLQPAIYAQRPDEIETLIKIGCRKKKDSAHYIKRNDPNRSGPFILDYENIICNVEVVDYKKATVLAKQEVGDVGAPVSGVSSPQFPGEKIKEFLSGFTSTLISTTRATPTGEVLSAFDLATQTGKKKESVSQYEGKEITVQGYAHVSSSGKRDQFMLGKKDYLALTGSSGLTLFCYVDPADRSNFPTPESSGYLKLTVVGTFENAFGSAHLKHCRLVKAE